VTGTVTGERSRRRLYMAVAAVAASLSVVLVLGSLTSSADSSGQAPRRSALPVVTEVPRLVPAGGVQVGVLVLMPPAATDDNTMDRNKAVDAAAQYGYADMGMKRLRFWPMSRFQGRFRRQTRTLSGGRFGTDLDGWSPSHFPSPRTPMDSWPRPTTW